MVKRGFGSNAGPPSTSVGESSVKAKHQRTQPCEAVQHPIPPAAQRLRSTRHWSATWLAMVGNSSLGISLVSWGCKPVGWLSATRLSFFVRRHRMSHDSDKFWGASEKVCCGIGAFLGLVGGFDGAGIGGAVLGLIVGGVLGMFAGSLISGMVSYCSPSANPRDFAGCFSTIGIIIAILLGIGLLLALIGGLWGVGKR